MIEENKGYNKNTLKGSKLEFKNFCSLNLHNRRTFLELHSLGLRYLFKLWCKEAVKNRNNGQESFTLVMS